MDKKLYIGVGVVVALAVGLFFLGRGSAPTPQYNPIGGVSFEQEAFTQGFTTLAPAYLGGKKTTLTTGATVIVRSDEFCDASLLLWEPTAANSTTTLPTSSSITSRCLTSDGARHSFLFRNISATSASTTNIVAGTGMVLLEPDGQNIILGGGNSAQFDCYRNTSSEIVCVIDEVIDAD